MAALRGRVLLLMLAVIFALFQGNHLPTGNLLPSASALGAFPTVVNFTAGTGPVALSVPVTIPGPSVAGDFLLIVVSTGDILPIAGCLPIVNWTGLFFDPTNCGFFKVNSSGLEPPTVTVSHVGPLMTSFAWQSWRIANADFIHLSGPGPKYNPPLSNISLPQPGVPPPFEGPNASAVAQNALWLGIITDSGFDDDLGSPWCTAAPAPYTALVNTQVGTVYPTAAAICSAERSLNALVEDPGLFTVVLGAPKPGIGGHASWTIALWGVFPIGPPPPPPCKTANETLPVLPEADPPARYDRGYQGISGFQQSGTLVWDNVTNSNRPIPNDGRYSFLDMATRSDNELFDFSGRNHQGRLVNSPLIVDGLYGSARCFLDFGVVDFDDKPDFDRLTVTTWVNVLNRTGNQTLVGNDRWDLSFNDTQFTISIQVNQSSFSQSLSFLPGNVTQDVWLGVAAFFDGETLGVIVDGTESSFKFFGTPRVIDAPTTNLTAGAIDTNRTQACQCAIDELAIWSEGYPSRDLFWATQRPSQVVIPEQTEVPISDQTLGFIVLFAFFLGFGGFILFLIMGVFRDFRRSL